MRAHWPGYNAASLGPLGRLRGKVLPLHTPNRQKEAAVGLQMAIRQSGDVTILDLQGRVTIGLGNDLFNSKLRQVVEGGSRKVLVNLGGTTQIDSSGISTIVRTFVTLERGGGSLKLLSPKGRVRDVLEVTRLLSTIPSFDDEAKALASFR